MAVSASVLRIHNGAYAGLLDIERVEALDVILACKDKLHDKLVAGGVEILDLADEVVEDIKKTQQVIDYVSAPRGTLRTYQSFGAFYMYSAKRMILGDFVGAGKTVQAAALFNILQREYSTKGANFKFIFVTGSTYTSQNRDVLIKRTGLYCDLIDGTEIDIRRWIDGGLKSVVASHSVLQSAVFCSVLIQQYLTYGTTGFPVIIIDECSIFKSKDTLYYQNMSKLSSLFEYVIGMNATIMSTDINDVYYQFDVVDPNLLPNISAFYDLFVSTYINTTGKRVKTLKNMALCREALRQRFLARTRRAEGALVENNTSEVIYVPASKLQKELIKKTTRWFDVYNAPTLIDKHIEFNEENVPKLKIVLELLADYDGTALVYVRNKEPQYCLLKLLQEEGIEAEVINGDTKKKGERAAILQRLNRGETRVLITNVTRGLDLKNSDLGILYGLPFTPAEVTQVEGRILRDFNIIGKHIKLIITEKSKESRYIKILAERIKNSATFNEDESLLRDLLLRESEEMKTRRK